MVNKVGSSPSVNNLKRNVNENMANNEICSSKRARKPTVRMLETIEYLKEYKSPKLNQFCKSLLVQDESIGKKIKKKSTTINKTPNKKIKNTPNLKKKIKKSHDKEIKKTPNQKIKNEIIPNNNNIESPVKKLKDIVSCCFNGMQQENNTSSLCKSTMENEVTIEESNIKSEYIESENQITIEETKKNIKSENVESDNEITIEETKSDIKAENVDTEIEKDENIIKPEENTIESNKILTTTLTHYYCEVCECRTLKHTIVKHLTSKEHFDNSALKTMEHEKMILNYIHEIVRESFYQCELCYFYFNSIDSFIKHFSSSIHIENDKKIDGKYHCVPCNLTIENNEDILTHLKLIKHEKDIKLIIQKNGTVTENILETPKLEPVQDDATVTFNNISRTTFKMKIKKIPKSYYCKSCEKVFDSRELLKEHYKQCFQQKPVKDVIKRCNLCGGIFENLKSFRKHVVEKHVSAIHKCDFCFKDFNNEEELQQHLSSKCKKNLNITPEFYSPPETILKTSQTTWKKPLILRQPQTTLTTPVVSTQAQPLFKTCTVCSNEIRLTNYDAHYHTHLVTSLENDGEIKTKEKKKPATTTSLQTKNVLKNDSIETSDQQCYYSKKYVCNVCDKQFPDFYKLAKDMKTHNGLLPYACPFCDASFDSLIDVMYHVDKQHPTRFALKCKHCICEDDDDMFKTNSLIDFEAHITECHKLVNLQQSTLAFQSLYICNYFNEIITPVVIDKFKQVNKPKSKPMVKHLKTKVKNLYPGKTLGLGNNNVPDKKKLKSTKAVTVKNIYDSTFINVKEPSLSDKTTTSTILNKKTSLQVPLALVSSNNNSSVTVHINWALPLYNETYSIKNNDFVNISQPEDNVVTIKVKDPFIKKNVQLNH